MSKKERFTLENYGVILNLDAKQFGELLLQQLGKFIEEAGPLYSSRLCSTQFFSCRGNHP